MIIDIALRGGSGNWRASSCTGVQNHMIPTASPRWVRKFLEGYVLTNKSIYYIYVSLSLSLSIYDAYILIYTPRRIFYYRIWLAPHMAVGLADSQVSMSIKLQPKQASNTKIMNQAVAIIQWVDFYSGDAEPKSTSNFWDIRFVRRTNVFDTFGSVRKCRWLRSSAALAANTLSWPGTSGSEVQKPLRRDTATQSCRLWSVGRPSRWAQIVIPNE